MNKKFLQVVLLLLFTTAVGVGQTGRKGALRGTVTDSDGVMLPGISITLESPALVMGKLTTVTHTNGGYRFLLLPPGVYSLTFEQEGMNTAVRKGIRVSVGRTVWVDVVMTVKPREENMVGRGKAPTIDRQKTAGVTNLDVKHLETIPSRGRTVMDYFNLTPGITGNMAHGSGEMENSYYLDGVNIGDPVTGTELVTFAIDTMEEVAVETGGLSAEYGSVKGAVLNIVTRDGGGRFSGSAFYYYDHENLQADNTGGTDLYRPGGREKTGRKFQLETGFNLGGPIINNKLRFFLALSMISKEEFVAGYPHDRPPEESIPIDQKEYFPHIKFTYRPSKGDTFFFSYRYSDLRSRHRGADRYYNEDTTRTQESPTHVFNVQWSKTVGTNFYANLNAAYIKSDMNLRSRWPGVQYTDWLTGLHTGTNWHNREDYRRDRYQVSLDTAAFIKNLAGSHELKIGGELQVAKTGWLLETNPHPDTNLVWQFNWPEYLGGTGIYYGFHIKSFDRKDNMLNYSLYFNDSWSVTGNLTLNLGIRFDYNSIIWPAQNQDEFPMFNPWGIVVDRRIMEPITPMKWKNLSPRLGIIYDIFADGSTLFKASWAGYVMPNTTQWVNLAHPNGWYYWMDVFYGYSFVQISQGLIRPGATKVGYKDRELIAPTSRELTVGIEREMGEDWSMGIRYIKKWDRNLVHVVDAASLDIDALMENGNLVWLDWEEKPVVDPYDGSTVTFYNNLDPSRVPQQYIVNPPGAERKYDGVEVTLNKRYSHGWSLYASYVYASSRGLIGLNRNDIDGSQSLGTSALWANPNAHINAEGRFPDERRHQVKIIGVVNGPWGMTVGAYFRRLSGRRWTRRISSGFLGLELKQISETIKAEKRGSRGYPPLTILDLKVEKAFKIGNLQIKLFADIFNAFNDNTVLEEYLDSSNPYRNFGEDLEIAPSRAVRLGAAIEF